MSASSSVKVAVRVRPFNDRERAEGAVLCVEMLNNMTRVYDPSQHLEKEFFFDYSYWSHDGFIQDPETGYMSKDSPTSKYADQQTVFENLGIEVLQNAWEGYNACLFAYGQTGSGKSYSMVGYGNNKGIIPITCEEIFRRINGGGNRLVDYKVNIGILEIYNEQIQDLLQPPNNRVKGGLKIRENPKSGVYVEGLRKVDVNSYEEITEQLDIGNKHRTVAATQMNATSSRAHTVLTITFTQVFYDEATGKPLNRKQSDINLVDLAGSERASKTGAQGDRLKEGSNINLSLSTLGKVITSLAKKGSGQLRSGEVIPYRESKLTRILQNALGGNSKTTMIAAISPATFNIEETISTLRYADQVKSIKNVAVVNETPQEKLIRELKEENERLKAMLEGRVAPDGQMMSAGGAVAGGVDEDMRLEYERQIEELRQAKAEAEKTIQQRIAEGPRQASIQKKVEVVGIHLSNLNEDPLLSGYIKHSINEGSNIVGKRGNLNPNIIVEGLGIGESHCQIIRNGDDITIVPSQDPNLKTMINGKILTEPVQLENQDRIRFGNHNYFLFIDPEELTERTYDWEFAINEANEEEAKFLLGAQDEELKRKEEEMKQKLQSEWEENQRQLEEERKKIHEAMSSKSQEDEATQKALMEKEQELLARQRQMEEEMRRKEAQLRQHEANRLALERLKQQLTHAIQGINEANERAVLLGKNVLYRPELYREESGSGPGSGMQDTYVRVKVIYPDISDDININWDLDKLEERLVDMQEICNQLQLGASINEIDIDYDPFSDEIDNLARTLRKIGSSYVYLDSIYYLLGVDEEFIPIIDDSGQLQGSLKVEVSPIIFGLALEDYDNLKEIGGKELNLRVRIIEAIDLPEKFSTNVFCNYKLAFIDEAEYNTETILETTTSPRFNYEQLHKVIVNSIIADEFLNHALAINVFGDLSQENKAKEIQKLKVNVKQGFNIQGGQMMVGAQDMEELDNISRKLEAPHSATLGISPVSHPSGSPNTISYSPMPPSVNTFSDYEEYQRQLEEKDRIIQELKAEKMRKEMEFQKRMEELDRREKMMNQQNPNAVGISPSQNNPTGNHGNEGGNQRANKKSKACVLF